MNATFFVSNIKSLVPSSNNLATASENDSIWWFASLNSSAQRNIVNSICHANTTQFDTAQVLSALNHTFHLSKEVQSDIESCVSSLGDFVSLPFNAIDYFYFNPFTPGSRYWFLEQSEEVQKDGVAYLCSGTLSRSHDYFRQVATYYSQGHVPLSWLANYQIGYCDKIWTYFETQTLSPAVTRSGATWIFQRDLVMTICANKSIDSTILSSKYKEIYSTVLLDAIAERDIALCGATRGLSETEIFHKYDLISDEFKFWFAIQNIARQKGIVMDICGGTWGIKNKNSILNVTQISGIFEGLIQFPDGPSNFAITRDAHEKMRQCFEIYDRLSFSELENELGVCHPIGLVWFNSQPLAVQNQFAEFTCKFFTRVSPTYQCLESGSILDSNGFRLHPITLQIMRECPKFADEQNITLRDYRFSLALTIMSAIMLIFLSVFVFLYERVQFKSAYGWSDFRSTCTGVNISLFIQVVTLLLYEASSILKWKKCFRNNASLLFTSCGMDEYLSSQIFRALWCISYLYFSSKRSKSLMKQTFPKSHKLIHYALVLSPIPLISPIIIQIVRIMNSSLASILILYFCQSIANIWLFIMDVLFGVCFMRFMNKTRADESEELQPRFKIISAYGFYACVASLPVGGATVIKTVFQWVSPHSTEVLNFCTMTSTVSMHLVVMVLLIMKVVLYNIAAQQQRNSFKSSENGKDTTHKGQVYIYYVDE